MPADQVGAFESFASYLAFKTWDGGLGYESFELAPGSYAVGVRNPQSEPQEYSLELDELIERLPPERGFVFSYASRHSAEGVNIPVGGWHWQRITVQDGFRYLVDGNNVRVSSWIIPADQLAAFESGGSFNFIRGLEAGEGAGPGCWELGLPAGIYYLAMRNTQGERVGRVSWIIDVWEIIG